MKSAAMALAALVAGLGAGYALGRDRVSRAPEPKRQGRTATVREGKTAPPERAHRAPAPPAEEGSGHAHAAPPRVDRPVEELLGELETRVDWSPESVDAVVGRLMAAVASGPEGLAAVLRKFRTTKDPQLAELLAIALGLSRHPEVERTALEMATGTDPARKAAGLDLLDRLETGSPHVTKALVGLFASESDPQVLGQAIYALTRDAIPPAEASAVVGSLRTLAANADSEVRRRAAVALAEWARDEGELGAVVGALRDPSPEVREGAAFALSQSRVTSASAAWALAERVADRSEDRTVREQAWQTLRGYPLADGRLFEIYSSFKAELESAGE